MGSRESLRGPLLYPLVRAVSRKWTGTLDTHTDTGLRHLVYFIDGCPAKVHTGELVAPLDVVLLRIEGAVDPQALAEAVDVACERRDVLLGQLLLERGLIDPAVLAAALRWQILDKLRYLLGDGTARAQHTLYGDTDLIQWPGNPELHPADPLYCMMQAARLASCQPIVARYIPRVLGMKLTLKADVDKRRFGLSDEESGVVAMLASGARTVAEIIDAGLPVQVVHPVIFALGVTESLSGRSVPPAAVSIPAPPPSIPAQVARVATVRVPSHAAPRVEEDADDMPEGIAPLGGFEPPDDADALAVDFDDDEAAPPVAAAQAISFAGWPANKAYEEAERALRFLEYSRADKAIAHAVKEDPGNPEYRALRAWIQAQLAGPVRGDDAYEAQLMALSEIIRRSPNIANAYYFRARLLKKLGRHEAAAPDFEMASILDRTNVDAARELEAYERRIKTRRSDADDDATVEKILKWFGR